MSDRFSTSETESLENENPFRTIQYTAETQQETFVPEPNESSENISSPLVSESQFEQPEYEQPEYEQPEYEQPEYEQPEYEQPEYEQPEYEQPEYEQPEYEQQFDKEVEMELFSNLTHDAEFEEFLSELSAEAESKFVNYVNMANPGVTELEQMLRSTDFEDRFSEFYMTNYEPIANKIDSEIGRFSAYLGENLQEGMSFESAQEVIDRYHVAEPEEFFKKIGKFFKKVGKSALGAIKTVGKFAGKVITAPLKLALKPILAKIGKLVRPLLKKVLSVGMRFIPAQYRELAQKAAAALGETNALSSEVLGELEFESESSAEVQEGFSMESETEAAYQEFDIGEIVHEFDRQVFEIIQSELEGAPQAEDYSWQSMAQSELEVGQNEALIIDDARNRFINTLTNENEPNLQKLTQEFIPAILPVLRVGIRLIGRDKVVNFIASLVAKLLNPLVGNNLGSPLSKVVTDIGLRMLTLETPETVPKKELMSQMIANIVGETVEKVSELPTTVLEGEDETLQSFIQEALTESIENNIPFQVLKKSSVKNRKLPIGTNWVHRSKGKYKSLSKVYKLTLDPATAKKIRTGRHGETLFDVLRKYQSWGGKTSVPIKVRLFEPVHLARLHIIARKHAGGSGIEFIKQILPLTRTAATLLLKDPSLATSRLLKLSMPGKRRTYSTRRFYHVKISTPNISTHNGVMGTTRSVQTQPLQTPEVTLIQPVTLRSNDVNLRFVQPNKFEAKIYINDNTLKGIRSTEIHNLIPKLLRTAEGLILTTGARSLRNLLTRLRIPSSVGTEITNLLLGVTTKQLNRNAGEISRRLSLMKDGTQGLTLVLTLSLPVSFIGSLIGHRIGVRGPSISKMFKMSPTAQIAIIPKYRL